MPNMPCKCLSVIDHKSLLIALSYHPSAEAFASMLTDMPYKILNAIIFNITLYFMTNLRREPGSFDPFPYPIPSLI
jgi:ABC-type multidrug transport system permease subunit